MLHQLTHHTQHTTPPLPATQIRLVAIKREEEALAKEDDRLQQEKLRHIRWVGVVCVVCARGVSERRRQKGRAARAARLHAFAASP